MSDISDIFISYAREDRPRVQRLAEVLKSCGWSVWWDRDLIAGPRFRDVIAEQLKSARCVVVVWSTHATKSDWVLDEAQDAKERGKLVAVRIDDVDLPFGFGQIQTADLVGWEGDPAQPEFRKLIGGAESLIGRAPGHLPLPPRQRGKLSDLLQKVTLPGWAAKATGWSVSVVVAAVIAVYAWNTFIDWRGPLKVAVMQFPEAPELSAEDASILRSTRARLNSILSNIGAPELDVTSSELMDAQCENLKPIRCAKALGIHKMISGQMSTSGSSVSLEVRVVDRRTGTLERSFPHEAPKNGLDKLQKQVAEDLLKWVHVKLTPEKTKLLANNFAKGTSQDYRDMLDTFPVAEEAKPTSLRPASPEGSESVAWGIAIAHAQEAPSSEKARIIELLRQYQEALKAKSPERCAELQVEMTDPQRDKLQRYFDNADGLSVEIKISDADIAVEGNEAVATFTRTDKFKEVPTGRDVQLEVRLSSLLTKQDGRWKIRGLKKPS